MAEIERVVAVRNHLGEGPIWSVKEQVLYWVDITPGVIYRWNPLTNEHKSWSLGYSVGCLGLRATGGLVLGTQRGLGTWDEQNGFTVIANPAYNQPALRFNDGKIDPQGRFWAGTMHIKESRSHPGCLYRLDANGSLSIMQTGVLVSNGIGWSLDHTIMYFTDSGRRVIYAYDFDPATGSIANRRRLITVAQSDGVPDGMTMDSEGCIWSCHWGGWRITRYDPTGEVMQVVAVPVERPSSCAFGGKNLDELYVTSAAQEISDAERAAKQPCIGDVLRIRPGVKGLPEPEFAE